MSNKSIEINSNVNAVSRYKKYLEIASIFMREPLTGLQMTILDELYNVGGKITTESRRTIRENMNISSEQLNNYIRVMRKAKVLIDDEVNPHLIPEIPDAPVMIITINLAVDI